MKYNRSMQLYAKRKRMKKTLAQAMEQTVNALTVAFMELAEIFKTAMEKMREMNMKYGNLQVLQIPMKINWKCPHCGMKNELSYTEFCAEFGEPCDWEYTKTTCPRCGETYCLGGQKWD